MTTKMREAAALKLARMSHKFPWKSAEWVILLQAANKLMFLYDRRPAHRPRRPGPDEDVRLAMGLCLFTGESATAVARYVEPILHPDKSAGLKNRVDYLAKRTRKELAKLSPDEVDRVRRCLNMEPGSKTVSPTRLSFRSNASGNNLKKSYLQSNIQRRRSISFACVP